MENFENIKKPESRKEIQNPLNSGVLPQRHFHFI